MSWNATDGGRENEKKKKSSRGWQEKRENVVGVGREGESVFVACVPATHRDKVQPQPLRFSSLAAVMRLVEGVFQSRLYSCTINKSSVGDSPHASQARQANRAHISSSSVFVFSVVKTLNKTLCV